MSRRRPPSPSRRRARPDTVKIGSVTVRIYRTTNRGSDLFTVSYYDAQGHRRRRNFRDGESARLEAQRVAASISRGESQVLQLTGDDRLAYERAVRTLEPLGRPIELVASEYVDATRILAGRASITEAARFFSRHASRPIRAIPLPDVLDEFLRQLALTPSMFLAIARALAAEVGDGDLALGRVYPALARIRRVTARLAATACRIAHDEGLALAPRPESIEAAVSRAMFEPVYPEYA